MSNYIRVTFNKKQFLEGESAPENNKYAHLIDFKKSYLASPRESGQFWDLNVWVNGSISVPAHLKEVKVTSRDLAFWIKEQQTFDLRKSLVKQMDEIRSELADIDLQIMKGI